MGVIWVRGTPQSFVDSPKRFVERVQKNLDMDAIVSQAAEHMKLLIQTRGTGGSWDASWDSMAHATPGRHSSSPGRDASGHMLGAVEYRVEVDGGKTIGSFGWLDTQEMYFLYQEKGFKHYIAGRMVPGMLALMDAGIEAREEFVRRVHDAVRSA